MKRAGDIIFIVGFDSFLIGICGYDSNPGAGFGIGIVGIGIAWIGYRMSMKKAPKTLNGAGAFDNGNR